MDKDILLDKVGDFVKFLIFIAIVLAFAYFSGFLKGFTPDDFKDAYVRISEFIKEGKSPASGQRFNNNLTSKIPEAVLRSSEETYVWTNVFNSSAKVIFYVYDDDDSKLSSDFHYDIQKYITKSPLKTKYNVYAYPIYQFKGIRTGTVGPSKICNSMEECNAQRRRAADYATMQSFFERCAKTMCIINPEKSEFVYLRNRNSDDAIKMINAMSNW